MTYDSNILALNPKHFWKMDETSGTVCTDYGSTPVNGVYNGGPTLNQAPLTIPSGPPGSTISSGPMVLLDGIDDSMTVNTTPGYTALTICMWVKNLTSSDKYWFTWGWTGGSSLPLCIGGAGDFGNSNNWSVGMFNSSSWSGSLAGSALGGAGSERFILATISSGGLLRLWENGRFKSQQSVSTFPAYAAGLLLRVGRRWDGTAHSNGLVSGVAMWDSVLSDSDILTIIPPSTYAEQTNLLEPNAAPNSVPWRPYGEGTAGGGGGGGGAIPTTGQLWPRGNW